MIYFCTLLFNHNNSIFYIYTNCIWKMRKILIIFWQEIDELKEKTAYIERNEDI